MADVDDFATELEMAERESVITKRRREIARAEAEQDAVRRAAAARGFSECLNCGARTPTIGDRFCDRYCRDDYERRRRAQLIGGTPPPQEHTHARDQPPGR